MERSLASEILCQGKKKKKKEGKILSTYGAFVQKMNFCSGKGDRVCVYKTNTRAPSGLCSCLPSLQGEAHYAVGTALSVKVKETKACFFK